MEDLTFGEQVKIVLGRRGMTIKQLAELIEVKTGKKMSRQNLTQRLGREADGNYVCLALCTGRKRWLIPFGEIFVFTIFYSFVYF